MTERMIMVPESALRELDSLFSEIRNDWTDPRSECRAGRAIIDTLLKLPDAEAAEAEAAALRKALQMYGVHSPRCRKATVKDLDYQCYCGLSAALEPRK